MKKSINAKIIADSIDVRGNRITSYLCNVPQVIVKELLRHRMFSFSSSSMRAIPFNKVLEKIKSNMFVPLAIQKHHSGMQGVEYLTGAKESIAKKEWIDAGFAACNEAEKLYKSGATKQICSRIIEPFGYAQILITATTFDNFFELRCPKYIYEPDNTCFKSKRDFVRQYGGCVEDYPDAYWKDINTSQAEIHIQALAESMWDAYKENTPKLLQEGQWHIPFLDDIKPSLDIYTDYCAEKNNTERLHPSGKIVKQGKAWDDLCREFDAKIAVARCARLSYHTHTGVIDFDKDLSLHDVLLASRHASPFEHIAQAMTEDEYYNDFFVSEDRGTSPEYGVCKNFKGFKSYRHILNL